MIREKTYVSVLCDEPDCDSDILAATVTSKRNRYDVHALARKAAATKGWRHIKEQGKYKDICPLCYAKRQEAKVVVEQEESHSDG